MNRRKHLPDALERSWPKTAPNTMTRISSTITTIPHIIILVLLTKIPGTDSAMIAFSPMVNSYGRNEVHPTLLQIRESTLEVWEHVTSDIWWGFINMTIVCYFCHSNPSHISWNSASLGGGGLRALVILPFVAGDVYSLIALHHGRKIWIKSFASCRGLVNLFGGCKNTFDVRECNGNSLSAAVPSNVKKC